MAPLLGFLRVLTAGMFSILMAAIEIIMLPVDFRKGRVFHFLARVWARGVLLICGLRVTVKGREKLDFGRSYVYVSNHASLFDIPAVVAGIPDQIRIVYKKELEAIPVFGWGLKWGSYIAMDRSNRTEAMKSIEAAAQKIRRGASVLLFAEGTRTLDGHLQPFKRGAFNLAVRSGVPVVPLTINGTFTILPKHSVSARPGQIELILESPILVNSSGGKDEEMRLIEEVHSAIESHYIGQA
jgi:1-acyl-sn-glycerol-3-phosphate acyltransferase